MIYILNFNLKEVGRHTVGDRLKPTLDVAIAERDKSSSNAKWTGITLNVAIGLQVLLGSLTTGLSALSASGGKSVNIFLTTTTMAYLTRVCFFSLKTAMATTALGMLFLRKICHFDEFRGQWDIFII